MQHRRKMLRKPRPRNPLCNVDRSPNGAQQDASFKAEENWLDNRLMALFEQPRNPGSKRGYRSDCLNSACRRFNETGAP
jgi:hypothetical protein